MTNEVLEEGSIPEEILPYEPDPKSAVRTLKEMLLGIILWGLVCELLGIWFVKEKLSCSLGLWAGCILALGCAIHMYWALDQGLSKREGEAQKFITTHTVIRYMVIVLVLGGIMISNIMNPLCSFLGLMGLKVAAYLAPFIDKILKRR